MTDPDYLTAAEAASRLGISLRTVRRRIADGSLPSARIGHAVRIPAAALDLPVARPRVAAAREAAAPYQPDADEDRAVYEARWNAAHWPDTFDRMLARRRRAFETLEAIRAETKPPTGPHDTVDAILDAVREEFGERLLDFLPPGDSTP
ncbi:MAG TPA: helix-turn-helix domain-containing protein [Candidatus Limnocylindrales bacterium]